MEVNEKIKLLYWRYLRAVDIFFAYKTYLNRQIKVGEDYCLKSEDQVINITHTLLLTFYSFIYSMFDQKGTDFISSTAPYLNRLSSDAIKIREELINIWEQNKGPITHLRHNVGFHGGTKIKGHEKAFYSLADLHPQIPEFILNHLALFFFEFNYEEVLSHPNDEERANKVKEFYLSQAEKLRKDLRDETFLISMKNTREQMQGLKDESKK